MLPSSPALTPRAVSPTVRPTVQPVTVMEDETRVVPEPLWRLVLLDDNDHSYDYVIEMLGAIFGYGVEKAFALARIVDTQGRVTLMTAERDACEAKQSQIHAYGADPRIASSKGSMSAIIEPIDAPGTP
ncbi:MAG: ATP-dependent Clp protease adaptor ClpS [Dehalococcoidia bacterium]|nr:MAG: ATP-dependent Clp protease adaptor ClpS [Dehalococcoidia bacterium]